jgi:hypothetical protein
MSPGRYTELFFLDEAVALAAGHRPCAECRRQRFNAFRRAWAGSADADLPSADAMDLELHPARIGKKKEKVTFRAPLKSLPDGCFVQIDASSYLVWGDALLLWSPEGYRERWPRPGGMEAVVLTPEPVIRCLNHGYRPEIHESAYRRG